MSNFQGITDSIQLYTLKYLQRHHASDLGKSLVLLRRLIPSERDRSTKALLTGTECQQLSAAILAIASSEQRANVPTDSLATVPTNEELQDLANKILFAKAQWQDEK